MRKNPKRQASIVASEVDNEALQTPDVNGRAWRQKLSRIMKNAKQRAKLRGRDFDLTRDYLRHMLSENPNCALSGEPLTPANISLDRIDSRRGYTRANVQFTTLAENRKKQDRILIRGANGAVVLDSRAGREWAKSVTDTAYLEATSRAYAEQYSRRTRAHRRTGRRRGRPCGRKTLPPAPAPAPRWVLSYLAPFDLTIRRAADMLGVTPQAVHRWVRFGVSLGAGATLKLPLTFRSVRRGTHWICPVALRSFLDAARRTLKRPVPPELNAMCTPERLKAVKVTYNGGRFLRAETPAPSSCPPTQESDRCDQLSAYYCQSPKPPARSAEAPARQGYAGIDLGQVGVGGY